MRKTWIVAKNEFLNQRRSKIFITLFIVLLLQSFISTFFLFSIGGNFTARIYERLMSVLSNNIMCSVIISIFCSAAMCRDVKSGEIDIFYSLNTSSTQYYIGKTFGCFLFYLPTYFIFALLAFAVDVYVLIIAGCTIDLQKLTIIEILYWFALGFIIRLVVPIAYGVVLPIAFSSFLKKSMALFASLSLCFLALFLPQWELLRYIHWLDFPYYSSYFFILHKLFPYPKASYAEAIVSLLCNVGILLIIFIMGFVKYRHTIANNRSQIPLKKNVREKLGQTHVIR